MYVTIVEAEYLLKRRNINETWRAKYTMFHWIRKAQLPFPFPFSVIGMWHITSLGIDFKFKKNCSMLLLYINQRRNGYYIPQVGFFSGKRNLTFHTTTTITNNNKNVRS